MKNKLICLLLLVFASLSKITAQDCLPDGIAFRTQEQVYNFPKNYLGYTQILNDVHIKESIAGNIANIGSIDQIIKINRNFSVANTTSLTSLNLLENLTSIGEYLKLNNNASLTSFSGWDNSGYIDVYDNASLENLTVVDEIIQKKTNPPYRIWVVPMDNTSRLKGYLTGVEDSLITVSNHWDQLEITQSINFQNIETIQFRKRRRVGKGFLYGALTGIAIGTITGLASGDDDCSGSIFGGLFCYTAEQKAVLNSMGLLIPGALIGGAIGSIRIKIPINGNYKTFEEQREGLLKFRILN